MRTFLVSWILFLALVTGVFPAKAQMNGDDLLRFGLQVLGGAAQQRQQPSYMERQRPGSTLRQREPRQASVAEIQRRLNQLGYAAGDVDGRLGGRTRQAIAAFQRDQGLAPTGNPDAGVLSALRATQGGAPQPSNAFANGSPSFDCTRARQPSERAVCRSPQLSALDVELARAYAAAASRGMTNAREQGAWMVQRNRCGNDAGCLASIYRQRLAQLGGADAPSVAPTGSASSQQAFTLLDGYDLPYGDYRSGLDDPTLTGIGPQGCQQQCAADGRCRGFTYNLRAEICILKSNVERQTRYAGAISGIKGGAPSTQPELGDTVADIGAPPAYADIVHLALMSDTEAYLADAARTGLAYIKATGTEQQCRQIYEMSNRDEFTKRDFLVPVAAMTQQVIAALPGRPRRLTVPVEAVYNLADYDFERKGFAFASYQQAQKPILEAGIVPLATEARPVFCNSGLGNFGFPNSGDDVNFNALGAEHAAVPGIDFLPMPEAEARALRESGKGKILLKATMTVEPRDQGRGPLKGRIVTLSAHDPASGRMVHRWPLAEAPGQPARPANPDSAVPWTGELLAALIGAPAERRANRQAFDGAAARYFSFHQRAIESGNDPPQSPLPNEAMRGRQPEVIAALNREKLRAAMRDGAPALPVAITAEHVINPWYDEEKGLQFGKLENDLSEAGGRPPWEALALSDRDRPVYIQLPFLRPWKSDATTGFREAVVGGLSVPVALELDRIVSLQPVKMGIEEAASRGLIGSSGQRDTVTIRWHLSIDEVREGKDGIILAATFLGLSYRWVSDGAEIASLPPETFPTVTGLREAADAALPPRATAENIEAPPAGTVLGAEIMDLLQLRFQPDTVDDRAMERMMITRFAYEAANADPQWGHFFRDIQRFPEPEERAARLQEFRQWSEARATALPETVTVFVPISDTPYGRLALFERLGPVPYQSTCQSAESHNNKAPTGKGAASARLCDFLRAAWQLPEPLLYTSRDVMSSTYRNGPRSECRDDAYCRAMRDARIALKLPLQSQDFLRVDRLPVLEPAHRKMDAKLAIEIDVKVTGGAAQVAWPETLWNAALAKAVAFDKAQALNMIRMPDTPPPSEPVMVFEAKAIGARLVDEQTRALVTELALAPPAIPPADTLDMPEAKTAGLDILGIRLGMPFEEADRIIRAHMQVQKVLTADRRRQVGTISGNLIPYTSGRIYASSAGNEAIAIFDEPPAAAEKVLGMWRILRLPRGGADPAGLKTTLGERYGAPRAVEEVSLPMMMKGVAFLWSDYADPDCRVIEFGFQQGLWQDETGNAWLPPFMTQPLFPILAHEITFNSTSKDYRRAQADFCSAFLGVRYASYDGRNYQSPVGDEIVTWLTDNRSYAEAFYENRDSPAPTPAQPQQGGASGSNIKF